MGGEPGMERTFGLMEKNMLVNLEAAPKAVKVTITSLMAKFGQDCLKMGNGLAGPNMVPVKRHTI